jgi:hypothetical protein
LDRSKSPPLWPETLTRIEFHPFWRPASHRLLAGEFVVHHPRTTHWDNALGPADTHSRSTIEFAGSVTSNVDSGHRSTAHQDNNPNPNAKMQQVRCIRALVEVGDLSVNKDTVTGLYWRRGHARMILTPAERF